MISTLAVAWAGSASGGETGLLSAVLDLLNILRGPDHFLRIDRITTHQNLEKLIAEGRFREDLFYRLNVISITLPALRDRGDDVIELAFYFLNRAAERAGKRVSHIDETVIKMLRKYGAATKKELHLLNGNGRKH